MGRPRRLRAVPPDPPVAWLPDTKFTAPPSTADAVIDQALCSSIIDGVDRGDFVLLQAPGGAGKTTVLAAALESVDQSVAWIRLDEWDDDASALAQLVVAAAGRATPANAESTQALAGSSVDVAPRQIAGTLINELAAGDTRITVVFDDLHHISDPEALRFVRFLIERGAPSVSVAATSRTAPDVGIERLRANGRLTVVTDGDLRFDTDRALELLNDRFGLELDRSRVERLVDASAGWAVALIAAARGDMPNERLPVEFGPYVAEVVLADESSEMRRFLRRTAVLGSLDPEACNHVAQVTVAGRLLDELRRRLSFLLVDDGDSLAYHDLLRARLLFELRGDAAEWSDAHRRAAQTTEGPAMIEHLLDAGASDEAAEALVEFVKPQLAGVLPAARILRWIDRVDSETRRATPWLDLVGALALGQQGRLAESTPLLNSALARCGDDYELRFLTLRHLLFVTADHRRYGMMLDKLSADDRFAKLPPPVRSEYLIGNAWGSLWAGDHEQVGQFVAAATEVVRTHVDVAAAESLAHHYAMLLAGGPDGLKDLVDYHLWARATFDQSLQVTAGARVVLEWSQCCGVDVYLGEELPGEVELIERVAQWKWNRDLTDVTRARLAGDPARAGRLFTSIWNRLDPDDPMSLEVVMQSVPTWASILRELQRPSELEEVRRQIVSLAATPAGSRLRIEPVVARLDAQHAWACGRFEEALHAFRTTAAGPANPVAVQSSVEEALLLQEMGRAAEASAAIGPILDEVQRSGLLARVGISGPSVADILVNVTGPRQPVANRVLDLLSQPAGEHEAAVPIPGTPETLSPREMDVLRELATGATNVEVGERLFVSQNTVKTHVRRILSKLGARSRLEAVAMARDHRLL